MRNIRFKKIIVEGFGSFASKTSFELDRGGVNLIKGENGNGKTTMFSALSWCLYKVNLKDTINEKVATWAHLQPADYKGTRVVLFFDIEGDAQYMIARHLDYKGNTLGLKPGSKLMIFRKEDSGRSFEKEDMVGEAQHKGDMQLYINRLMGVDSKAFLNSVLFGQRMKRLIESDNKDKRELFESLFDVEFVELAKERAKVRKAVCDEKVKSNSKDIETANQLITAKNEEIKRGEEIVKNFETDKKKRIADLTVEKQELTTKLNNAKIDKKVQKALADKYDSEKAKELKAAVVLKKLNEEKIQELYDESYASLKASTKSLNSSVEKLAKHKQDLLEFDTTCPVCKSQLDKKKVEEGKKNLKDLISKEETVGVELGKVQKENEKSEKNHATQLTVAKSEHTKAQEDLDKYIESVDKYKKAFDTLSHYTEKVNDLDEQIEKIDAKITKEQETKPPAIELEKLRADVVDSETKIKQLQEDSEKQTEESARLDWWVKKGFGAGGLKAFVFNAMLNQLNIFLETYASRLGVGVRFSIDLTKDSKPFVATCYMGEHTVDYAELSGGQKQRVDVCIAFAMHDIVVSTNRFNILILDEVFEGLDENGIKAIFDLIRLKASGKRTVYVITHSPLVDGLNAKNINVTFENKLSYIQ